ncbi:MAG: hypothetical protein U1F71_07510 [Verrucomicrobiaceae bacterium]
MATPSPEPRKSWQQLTASARNASAPADLDMRVAIRAEITSQPARVAESAGPGLFDDLASLIRVPWFLAGTAALAIFAYIACQDGFDAINELALVWHLQGPVTAGI